MNYTSLARMAKKANEKELTLGRLVLRDQAKQMELSEELGISQAQISRIEKNALENIRRMIS